MKAMDKLRADFEADFENETGWSAGDYPSQEVVDLCWRLYQQSRASIVVEPTYFVLKLDESNEWGYAEDLTVYETELDASKAKDDFGGEIIPVIDLHSIGLSIKGE